MNIILNTLKTRTQKKLTLSEIFDLNLQNVSRDEIFDKKGIQLEDNCLKK